MWNVKGNTNESVYETESGTQRTDWWLPRRGGCWGRGGMGCLYILGSKRLSVTSFAHIFFHSVCCHLILFMASFALQKLLCLIGSHLFLFLLPWETDLRRSIFLSFFIQGAWITGVVAEREWVILKNRNSWMKNDLRGSLPSGENFLDFPAEPTEH